jgi:imidazolonepropionase-like amidohydrolase
LNPAIISILVRKIRKIMKMQTRLLMAGMALAIATGLSGQQAAAASNSYSGSPQPLLINAPLLFDGTQFKLGQSVLVQNGKIVQVAPPGQIKAKGVRIVNVPGGTILPGFIDLHTHHLINGVSALRMLEHGVTTARDLGSAEPLTPTTINKPYQLRQFLSGPIIQAVGGYPNVVFPGSGVEVAGVDNVRAKVDSLVKQGASVIAVSLEKGGEFGAPWHWHDPSSLPPWLTLTTDELNAIVDQAHNIHHIKVAAYFGDDEGAQRALAAGVDEWAHMPCDPLSPGVIAEAGAKQIAIDGTIDTEVQCTGVHDNAADLVAAGARLFYATDMGHPDIPHGIDAQEIHMGLHVGFHTGKDYMTSLTQALTSATKEGGKYLGLSPLGQIVPGAPADLIVIGSDVTAVFKELEYPKVVIKNGWVVIERAQGE